MKEFIRAALAAANTRKNAANQQVLRIEAQIENMKVHLHEARRVAEEARASAAQLEKKACALAGEGEE